ncbi:MAG: hypothetical protein AAB426_00210 [Myxococcota bacterium]
MKHASSLVVLLASLLASSMALAQGTRDGFFLQATGGLGHYSSSAEVSGIKTSYGGTTIATSLLLGGTIMEGLAIGGGLLLDYGMSPTYQVNDQEVASVTDFSQYVMGLTAFADYYLSQLPGAHVQGMIGWGGLETSVNGNAGGSDPTGMVLALGGGYEWWMSQEWSIGVLARVAYGKFSLNSVGYGTLAPALVASLTYY